MKKVYVAPMLEVEHFELNSAVAAGCDTIVVFGPDPSANDDGKVCEYFGDPFEENNISLASNGPISFYESDTSVCDCYYSSGNSNYVTS